MKSRFALAEVNIHTRAQDKVLIDEAAELTGANRSQFMLASALKEAKNVLLDQITIYADNRAFEKELDRLEAPATKVEAPA